VDPIDNPYTPNARARPLAIVGRDEQIQRFQLLLKRLTKARTEQSVIITGLRGVGKTVLLGSFRDTALDQGWMIIEEGVSKHDDADFRRNSAARLRIALFELSPKSRWNERIKRAASVLKPSSLPCTRLCSAASQ
jgi:predicted AAA+ superfamily ATPase